MSEHAPSGAGFSDAARPGSAFTTSIPPSTQALDVETPAACGPGPGGIPQARPRLKPRVASP
ncbi:hypothetical protein, partial [Streptomyces sp. SM13]|uniref:hypothetical protein n=1 Tax=Streptomyces sp. SM13 TaxID=1983803 RepID=UPI001CA4BC62